MTVVQARQPGAPDVLETDVRAVPVPAAGEVLVKCRRRGEPARPDAAPGQISAAERRFLRPGARVSGVIVAVGAGVSRWRAGDRGDRARGRRRLRGVCGGARTTMPPVPRGLSMEEAAALPETFFTVWTNVFERGRLWRGSRCWSTAAQRHRHHRHPVRARPRRPRVRDGRVARESAWRASGSAPSARSTIATRTSSRPCSTRPRPRRRRRPRHGRRRLRLPQSRSPGDGRTPAPIAFLHGPHADVDLGPRCGSA